MPVGASFGRVTATAAHPATLLLVDDDRTVLSALADLVADENRLRIIGTATCLAEAADLAREHQPDLALVDVRMVGGGGEELTRLLGRISPGTRVVAHSASLEEGAVAAMVAAGAHGYIAKGQSGVAVTDVLIAAAAGRDTFQVPASWVARIARSDESAREMDARFRGLVEGLPGYVYKCAADALGTSQYVSPQVLDVTGYSVAEHLVAATGWVATIHPEDREAVVAAFAQNLVDDLGFRAEYRILAKNGDLRWVRDHGTTVRDGDGKALYVQGVVLDITQATQAAQALRENEAKSRFLASMSHELRTPLNSILGFAQLLAAGSYGELNERQGRYVENISTSGHHLLTLINDVLDLAKVTSGQMQIELERASLNEAIADALAKMGPMAEKKGLHLATRTSPRLVVLADRRRLHQVLLNLISNAVKFTPAGGSIKIDLARTGPDARVTVTDTGIGIPQSEQVRIFDEFTQADGPASQSEQGTGLGLALTRELLRLMGGSIGVTSEAGQGSTFAFTLPLA
jgi:PAS domain S-box-containing protein